MNGFKIEAVYEDRSERERAFATYSEAAQDRREYDAGVTDRRDRSGPIRWRLSVRGEFDKGWHTLCHRMTKAELDNILAAIRVQATR